MFNCQTEARNDLDHQNESLIFRLLEHATFSRNVKSAVSVCILLTVTSG